jgi:nicotinate dehydrogenase subunit A
MTQVAFELNGRAVTVTVDDPDMPLLYALRNDLELRGPKYGCGLAQCGACRVMVDGQATFSCVTPVSAVAGLQVVTLEGLAKDGRLHPVQQAFVDEQAVQCGYCTNGMVIAATALLNSNRNPSDNDITAALEPHLCRCGTQPRVVAAVRRAAAAMRG